MQDPLLALWHLFVSGVASGVMVGLASLGMALTTEGRFLSMLIEPFSLLFVPGVILAMASVAIASHMDRRGRAFADSHEFTARFVVWCTFFFWVAVLYWLQRRRGLRAAQTMHAGSR